MKQRRPSAKEMQRVINQLKKWCAGKDRVALGITGQFFHLTFGGHLEMGPKEGGFVFQSPESVIVSALAPSLYDTIEVEEKNGRRSVTMRRKEGQITITEIDTLAHLLTSLPLMSRRVQ